uniref:Dephospho-CoA kinase domain-containing protein n=1 Tax=Xenopsylla cheopis TaxID=163159 RepID=A0A6M2DHF5_XENCH
MFIVGLTGGIGTGKSTVAKIFKDNGVPVIDADVIAREIVQPGKPAWRKIRAEFGTEVFYDNGEINREHLGKIIFSDVTKRQILNKITHPEIHRNVLKQAAKYLFLGHAFVVLDLPLLFETGKLLNYIYKIITVTCEEDLQLARIIGRNNFSEEEAKRRISSQMPLDKKCEMSDFVIENSGSQSDTLDQTLKVLRVLQASKEHWKIRGILLATAALLVSGLAWLLNKRFKTIS